VPAMSSMAGYDISDVTSYFLNHFSKNFIVITKNMHSILSFIKGKIFTILLES